MDSVYEKIPLSFCRLRYCKLVASLVERSDFDLF